MPRFYSKADITPELENTLDVMNVFKASTHEDMLGRVFSDAVCEDRLQAYIKRYNLKESSSRQSCLCYFLGKRCSGNDSYVSDLCIHFDCRVVDHHSVWTRNGKPFVFIFQPYDLSLENMRTIIKVCDEYNLVVDVSNHSWHFPSATLLIEVHHKEWRAELRQP